MTAEKVIVRDRVVSLTEEQLSLFGALTRLQKNVALKSLEGLSDVQAYIQGGGKAKNENSIAASASVLLNNSKVKAFLDSFNAHVIAPSIMTRTEMLERLTSMARTSLSDIVEFHENVIVEDEETGDQVRQSFWAIKKDVGPEKLKSITKLTASPRGISIETHDEKAAMKQLADLEGYNAAVRVALGGDSLSPPIQTSDLTDEQLQAELAKYGIKPEDS